MATGSHKFHLGGIIMKSRLLGGFRSNEEGLLRALIFRTGFILLAFGVLSSQAIAVSNYTVTDLGIDVQSMETGQVQALNDQGQIAGWLPTDDGYSDGFILENGVFTFFGIESAIRVVISDINNAGQVVGRADPGSNIFSNFLWDNGQLIDLSPELGNVTPKAINDSGVMVGNNNSNAFLIDSNGLTDLGTLGGRTSASDINNSNQVSGGSFDAANESRAFIWENGVITELGLDDTGVSTAAINNLAQIVGNVCCYGGGFLWDNGTAIDLATDNHPSVSAVDINDLSQIVGSQKYLWENGVWYDLNDLVDPLWEIGGVDLINNAGQLIAHGRYAGGGPRNYVL